MSSAPIQLHRLEGFYWVARTGGYARAARAFPYPITQPAVHQQVKKLSEELGLELFERVGKDRMQLTAAGKRLFGFIAPFYEELPSVLRSMKGGDFGGVLKIFSAPLFLRRLLPGWIKRLHRLRPDVEVQLTESTVPDLDALRRGEADLMIDHLPEPPDDVATMRIARMRPWVVMPADHSLAGRKRVSLSEFAGDTFVGYTPGTLPHSLQMDALAQHGVTPRQTLTVGSAEAILGFVESGLGFSLIPHLDPDGPRSENAVALPLTSPKVEFDVVAAWRKDTPDNPLLDAALETAPRP